MTRFVASLMTNIPTDASTPHEAAVHAREAMRQHFDELILIIRDQENGVVTTYDPVDETIEYHDLNGNEITEAEAIMPRLRPVD